MNANKLTAILKYCYKNYYIKLVSKYKDDIKQTWKILNAISKGKKCEHSNPSDFVVTNEYTINHKNVTANKFNSFFVNEGQELASEIQHINNNTANMHLGNSNSKSFFFRYISEKEILSVVAQLTNKFSTDCDHICMVLIKNCIVKYSFTYICNKSFESCIYPDNTTISKVIPVFTAGNKSKCNNYRPIALLPQLSNRLFGGGVADVGNAAPTFCFSVPAILKLTSLTVESL